MDTVGHILKEKGAQVHATSPDATVLHAVDKMCGNRVGALLVCDNKTPIGIFTERDLMTRVILEGWDPKTTKVSEVMSRDVACVGLHTRAEEAMAIMTERRCRHLPVVDDDGQLAGIISIGDLVRWASLNQEYEIRMLTDYIHGKYPG